MSLSPESELTPPAESAPDPDQAPPRIPNLGHAAIFVLTAAILLMLFQLGLYLLGESPASTHAGAIAVQHPKLQLAVMGATYFLTLGAAWLFYPLIWHRSLLQGIRWHWPTARNQAARLIGLGIMLGIMMQAVTYFITPPKSIPIDEFFLKPSDAWLITIFGTLVAPVFEEICFRGFLLPAFAIAYDWLSLSHTEAARTQWQTTTTLSPMALIFSAILTSICFAMLHFQQVAHLWAATLGLFTLSLILTFVRIKTQSVAASAMVHAAYNGFVFIAVLIATGGYRHLDRMTH
jgi:membrane protease YdiL (CAAX protease family)